MQPADVGITLAHRRREPRPSRGSRSRRRTLAGRTGCGLCGTESLEQVQRALPMLVGRGPRIAPAALERAQRGAAARTSRCSSATGARTRAAWCAADGAILAVREDVGRHNALDKLIGALVQRRRRRRRRLRR